MNMAKKSILKVASVSLAFVLTLSCSGDSVSNSGNNNDNDILPSSGSEEELVSSSSLTAGAQSSSSGTETPSSDSVAGISSSSSEKNTSSSSFSVTYGESVTLNDFTFDDVQYWVGEGSNRAALIVQWNDGKNPDALVWGYKWNGNKTGNDMIRDIAQTDPRIFMLLYDHNSMGTAVAGIGYDFSGNSSIELIRDGADYGYDYLRKTPVNGIVTTPDYDFDFWTCTEPSAHWGSAWYDGFWSYWVKDEGTEYEFSGMGTSGRPLKNGSIDVWWFVDEPPITGTAYNPDLITEKYDWCGGFYFCIVMGEVPEAEIVSTFGPFIPVASP